MTREKPTTDQCSGYMGSNDGSCDHPARFTLEATGHASYGACGWHLAWAMLTLYPVHTAVTVRRAW